jgi:hypothetical protein
MFASSTFWYIYLAYGTQQVTTALQSQISFARVYTSSRRSLCISDAPSLSTNVSSVAQCSSRCIGLDNCNDFNVINRGSNSGLECQLFLSGTPLHYGIRSACRSFQVRRNLATIMQANLSKCVFIMRRFAVRSYSEFD